MYSTGFVARAMLRESAGATAPFRGSAAGDPRHVVAMEAATVAYNETMALLEAGEDESRARRYGKRAAKAALAGAGLYGLGAGAVGAMHPGYFDHRSRVRGAVSAIKNPRRAVRRAAQAAKGAYANAAHAMRRRNKPSVQQRIPLLNPADYYNNRQFAYAPR